MPEPLPREATSTQPEDIFVDLFSQAFGVEKVRLLSPEHPVRDILPRYHGDVEDPTGGVRSVISGKGNYLSCDGRPESVEAPT